MEGDLGSFGLGLKTASLSQCRQLTVASKGPKELRRSPGTSTASRKAETAGNLIEGLRRLAIDALAEPKPQDRDTGRLAENRLWPQG